MHTYPQALLVFSLLLISTGPTLTSLEGLLNSLWRKVVDCQLILLTKSCLMNTLKTKINRFFFHSIQDSWWSSSKSIRTMKKIGGRQRTRMERSATYLRLTSLSRRITYISRPSILSAPVTTSMLHEKTLSFFRNSLLFIIITSNCQSRRVGAPASIKINDYVCLSSTLHPWYVPSRLNF